MNDPETPEIFKIAEEFFDNIMRAKERYKNLTGKYPAELWIDKALWTKLGKPVTIHDIPVKSE